MKKIKIISIILVAAIVMGIVIGCKPQQNNDVTEMTTIVSDDEATRPIETTEMQTTVSEIVTTVTEIVTTVTESETTAKTEDTTIKVDPLDPTKHIVAGWIFDEIVDGKVVDISGNGNDAIVSGNCKIYKGSVYMEDLGDNILVKDSDDLDFTIDESFTLSIRAQWDGEYPDNWACLVNRGLMLSTNAYKYYGVWISTGNQVIQFGTSNESQTGITNYASMTADLGWHTYTIVQDAGEGTLSFYIDGELYASTSAKDFVTDEDLFIGYNGNKDNQGQWVGMIDEIIFYDIAIIPEAK